MRTETTGDAANPISPVEQHNRRLMETVGRLRQVAAAIELIEHKIVGEMSADVGEFVDLKPLDGLPPMQAADYAMDVMHILVDRMARGPIEAMAGLIGHSQLVPFDPEPTQKGDQWRPDRDAPSTRGMKTDREYERTWENQTLAAKQDAAAAAGEDGELHFCTRFGGRPSASDARVAYRSGYADGSRGAHMRSVPSSRHGPAYREGYKAGLAKHLAAGAEE